ncbi:MAG: hypothetical protein ACRC0Y_11655 [Fusobacteriaceae bacterium]
MNKKRVSGVFIGNKVIQEGSTRNTIVKETFSNISKLNADRGNLKGFVFEHIHAKEMNYELMKKGLKAEVIDNNGLADIVVKNMKTGKVVERIQTKCGYESGATNVSKYVNDGQTIVINGDSKNLAQNLTRKGVDFKKSTVTNKEVTKVANLMKIEKKLLGTKNAPITSKALEVKEIIGNTHNTGLRGARKGALFGAGISIGSNTVEVIRGDKNIEEAIADVTIDTAIAGATGYVVGVAMPTIISTSIGGAAVGAVSSGVGTLAATTAGTAVIGAVGTASAGIATATTAITGVIASGASVAAATTAGAAVVGAGTAIASTAAGAAIVAGAGVVTAAAVAAAPIVIGGAIIGGVCKIIGGWFD